MALIDKDNRGLWSGPNWEPIGTTVSAERLQAKLARDLQQTSTTGWANQQGYKLKFTHQSTEHSVQFAGSILSFQDTHASQQKLTYLYGEVDPITRTQNTMRKIAFTFVVSNGSLYEARHNEQNLNFLICMMYPKRSTLNTNQGVPLLRVKGLNFIANSVNSNGVGMYISQLVYSPIIDAGFVVSKGTGALGEDEIYPTQIEIQIAGDVRIDKYVRDDGQPLPSTYPTYNG